MKLYFIIIISETRLHLDLVPPDPRERGGGGGASVCAARAIYDIPATLIGNWEIAGIRSRDVSQSEDITVIGHLKLPERKVTFVLVQRTFGKMFYVTTRASRLVRESSGIRESSTTPSSDGHRP